MGEQQIERRLTTILAADVAGYSRLTGADEEGTLARLRALRKELVDPALTTHRGRIVKTAGDGLLAEFASVVDAARAAVELQRAMATQNAEVPVGQQIQFRIGINLGDVVVEADGDLMGDGVNVAARLEGIAGPGGIFLSRAAYDQVKGKIDVEAQDLGDRRLKNITEPVRVYAISPGARLKPAARSMRVFNGQVVLTAIAVAAIVLIVAGGWWLYASRTNQSHVEAKRLSIVVLPFTNLSGDPAQDYFADGITENLTTGISHIPGSFVIARNTAFTFKGKPIDVKAIGKDLGVRYVLEGSVQRSGAQVQVDAQLIDAESAANIWAERFEATAGSLLDLQNQVTDRLAREFGVQLLDVASRRSLEERPSSPDVEDLLLRAGALQNQPTSPKREEAIRALYETILKLDAQSALAWARLSQIDSSRVIGSISKDPAADLRRADEELRQAQMISPNLAMVHWAKISLHWARKEPEQGIAELSTLDELEPGSPAVKATLGVFKIFVGDPEETENLVAQAIRLSPHDPSLGYWYEFVGTAKLCLGKDDEAIDWLSRSVRVVPNWSLVRVYLTAAYGLSGRTPEAKAELAELMRLLPGYTVARFKATEGSTNPRYLAYRNRLYEGLRKAGMPEQ